MSSSSLFDPIPLNYPSIYAGSANVEYVLNWLGYLPVVSSVSGIMRQFLGWAQVIGAVLYVAYNIFRSLMADSYDTQVLFNDSREVLQLAWHGLGNVVRGQFESIPFINLSFILYDRVARVRMFYPSPSEVRPQGFYALLR